MKHRDGKDVWYRAEPRTPKEREVFTVMTVTAAGADLYLASEGSALHLQDAAACAVLEELAGSARRRLLEMEIEALPQGGVNGQPGATGAAVGAAPEARPRPHDPG